MLERAAGAAALVLERPFADSAFGGLGAVVLRPSSPAELLAPLSGAFDLAESQSPGHAVRVAHLAVSVATRLGVEAATRRSVLYAALLHDSGVAVRDFPGGADPGGAEGSGGHTAAGAWVASRFGLDQRIQDAIRCTHERWDGQGRPHGLAMEQVPLESLIVSSAHWACDLAEDPENPLRARARILRASPRDVEPAAGARVAEALGEVLRDDSTWTGLWNDALPALVAGAAGGEGRPTAANVEQFAAAMGEVVDASAREPGRSARVATLAGELAGRVGVSARERRAVGVAALLMDIGQLGVPHYVADKPDVLTVDEVELIRRHPGWAARIIDFVPGLEQIARAVEAHHERPDGRGYSEQLAGDEIPLAARILAVADAYWALRAVRPYRETFSAAEAVEIIEASAGTQYDAELAGLLTEALADGGEEAASSRGRSPELRDTYEMDVHGA